MASEDDWGLSAALPCCSGPKHGRGLWGICPFFLYALYSIFLMDHAQFHCLAIQRTVWVSFWYPFRVWQPFGCQATVSWSSKIQLLQKQKQNGHHRFGVALKFYGQNAKVAHFSQPFVECKSWGQWNKNRWVGAIFHFLAFCHLFNCQSLVVIFQQRVQVRKYC